MQYPTIYFKLFRSKENSSLKSSQTKGVFGLFPILLLLFKTKILESTIFRSEVELIRSGSFKEALKFLKIDSSTSCQSPSFFLLDCGLETLLQVDMTN